MGLDIHDFWGGGGGNSKKVTAPRITAPGVNKSDEKVLPEFFGTQSNRVWKWWRHKNDFSEVMGFIQLFNWNNLSGKNYHTRTLAL